MAVDGSWEEVTDKLEVNQPTAAWMLELLDDICTFHTYTLVI